MPNQNKPVYLKLRDMIAAAIIDGRYAEGEMLPSLRALASEQGEEAVHRVDGRRLDSVHSHWNVGFLICARTWYV